MPLGGIAAVAFILLLVSAALFYLHTKGRMEGIHMSAMPAAVVRQVRAARSRRPDADGIQRSAYSAKRPRAAGRRG